MARKQTKADLILSEARTRCVIAESAVFYAQQKVDTAQAELKAHRDAYQALDKALAPKPRKVKTAAAQTKKTEPKQPKLSPTGDGSGKDGTNGES